MRLLLSNFMKKLLFKYQVYTNFWRKYYYIVTFLTLFIFFYIFLKPFIGCENCDISNFNDRYNNLDRIAQKFNADKASNQHNYTKIYAEYLYPFTLKHIKMVGLGFFNGSAIQLWEEYFPKAEMHFVDIVDKDLNYISKRSNYHYLDQANLEGLRKFGSKYGPFDLIIDDDAGRHAIEEQINAFKVLFKHVKPGGLYIIEDLYTSYDPELETKVDKEKDMAFSFMGFLKQLIDDVNMVGAITNNGATENLKDDVVSRLSYYAKKIDSMHFYNSMCVIRVK